jgi:hypothetical protein
MLRRPENKHYKHAGGATVQDINMNKIHHRAASCQERNQRCQGGG